MMKVRSVANFTCELLIMVFLITGSIITSNLLVALHFMFSLLPVLTPFVVMYNDTHFLHGLNLLAFCDWL